MTLKEVLINKHLYGQEKYGEFTFLEKDMRKEAHDELVDAINYLTYSEIKKDFKAREIKSWTKEKLNTVFIEYISKIEQEDEVSRRLILSNMCKTLCFYHS